jgi:prepilin-type N-terminal cleavage/methylation domain-containing protein
MRVLQRKLLLKEEKEGSNKLSSKGYSLLELVIAISISLVIIAMLTYISYDTAKNYRQVVTESKHHFYINEVFRFLEVQLNDNVKKIDATNDCLTLSKYKKQSGGQTLVLYSQLDFSTVEINKIKFMGSELQIEYANSATPVALLLNVELFKVEKMKDKLFITIKMKEGQYYKRCYDLRYIEN